MKRTPNLTEKPECRLNKPARHNNDEIWLRYHLWSLSERFTTVGVTHAWDRVQGCCQGQFNVIGFSICQVDSAPSGIPVRTFGIVNINRISIPLKQRLKAFFSWNFLWSFCTYGYYVHARMCTLISGKRKVPHESTFRWEFLKKADLSRKNLGISLTALILSLLYWS